MKVLVIGGGGREHALAWKIAQNRDVSVICAPGNGGISEDVEIVKIPAENIDAIVSFAEENKVDFTVVGPEAPLVNGIVDRFFEKGLKILGPGREGALLEGSKSFAKELMKEFKIPTAEFRIFTSPDSALDFVRKSGKGWVVKADGLAGGKGVIVCENVDETLLAIERIMVRKEFGEAGKKIVMEEKLNGIECSAIALFDGRDFVFFPLSQDHKRVFDYDRGPNTGGMGAYSPLPFVTPSTFEKIKNKIFYPLADALSAKKIYYRGVIYAGLMLVESEPYVLEFNVRFGDPETQPLMMTLESDLFELLYLAFEGKLKEAKPSFSNNFSVCVVMASQGYPENYEKGKLITGLDRVKMIKEVKVFHAGTKKENGQFYTDGGRVLGVTSCGKDLQTAIYKAYGAVSMIKWEGVHYRKDIGKKGLLLKSL